MTRTRNVDERAARPGRRSGIHGRGLWVRLLLGLVSIVLVSMAVMTYFEQENQRARILDRQAQLAAIATEAARDFRDVQDKMAIVDTDAYVEQVARDQLGMVKPGETVFLSP